MVSLSAPTDADFVELLRFRDALRRFLRWSEDRAKQAGLTAAQHQLLLAIRGHGGHGGRPTIGDVAEHLLLRHHSVVELVDRAQRAGLLTRIDDPDDHRTVRLELSATGATHLDSLTADHLDELHRLQQELQLKDITPR